MPRSTPASKKPVEAPSEAPVEPTLEDLYPAGVPSDRLADLRLIREGILLKLPVTASGQNYTILARALMDVGKEIALLDPNFEPDQIEESDATKQRKADAKANDPASKITDFQSRLAARRNAA